MRGECHILNRGLLVGLLFLCFSVRLAGEEWLPERQGTLVHHTYYVLDFNDEHHQANWVYYEMSPERLVKRAKRKDDFREDPALGECATLADYRKSGYDRGHLCPAADMAFSEKAMSETFYLSNMSPQVHACNAGVWSRLEAHVRERAEDDHLYVVTGPVFEDVRGTIGKNEVTVPGYFYKLFYSPAWQQMVAYVVPNRASSQPVAAFAVPVDKVERLTGIDFFPGLPDELERIVEADTFAHAGDPYIAALLDAMDGKATGGGASQRDGRAAKAERNRETASPEKVADANMPSSRQYTPSAQEQAVLIVFVVLLFLLWRVLARRGKKAKKKSTLRRRSGRSSSKNRKK